MTTHQPPAREKTREDLIAEAVGKYYECALRCNELADKLIKERAKIQELERKIDVVRKALEWEKHRCGDLQGPLKKALSEIKGGDDEFILEQEKGEL